VEAGKKKKEKESGERIRSLSPLSF